MTTIKAKTSLSPAEARQGGRGMRVFVVLIAALVLAAIGWVGVEMWGQHINPDKSQTDAPAPGAATGSTAQPSKIDNSAPAGQPTQSAPTDKSENNQQGIKSTPAQPSRDGVQN
ncbi:hypothetical protein AB4Z52_32045 [Rhizobium sp. 2YAF20]|uniref:hypothetical protein n=1 Tax=Rhizobium sp. 2YAF20 TaxID=3233027 RepID=UPI003F95173C